MSKKVNVSKIDTTPKIVKVIKVEILNIEFTFSCYSSSITDLELAKEIQNAIVNNYTEVYNMLVKGYTKNKANKLIKKLEDISYVLKLYNQSVNVVEQTELEKEIENLFYQTLNTENLVESQLDDSITEGLHIINSDEYVYKNPVKSIFRSIRNQNVNDLINHLTEGNNIDLWDNTQIVILTPVLNMLKTIKNNVETIFFSKKNINVAGFEPVFTESYHLGAVQLKFYNFNK